MQAAEGGRIKYRSTPCRNCGGVIRYTRTGRCIACEKRHAAEYHAAFNRRVREALTARKE